MKQLRWKIAQAAEIRWWKNYLRKKDKNDYLTWKRQYWLKFLEQCDLAVPAQAQCLDAGCGPAGIFTILDTQQVTAIDPLLDQYQHLEHFNQQDYPNVQFQTMPLEQLAVVEHYDYIFCLNAINHVADLTKCWQALMQAAKPGGTLVISIDAHNYSFFKRLFRLLPGDILHPHQYDLKEYQSMVTQYGGQLLRSIHHQQAFFFDYYSLVIQKPINGMLKNSLTGA